MCFPWLVMSLKTFTQCKRSSIRTLYLCVWYINHLSKNLKRPATHKEMFPWYLAIYFWKFAMSGIEYRQRHTPALGWRLGETSRTSALETNSAGSSPKRAQAALTCHNGQVSGRSPEKRVRARCRKTSHEYSLLFSQLNSRTEGAIRLIRISTPPNSLLSPSKDVHPLPPVPKSNCSNPRATLSADSNWRLYILANKNLAAWHRKRILSRHFW